MFIKFLVPVVNYLNLKVVKLKREPVSVNGNKMFHKCFIITCYDNNSYTKENFCVTC